VPWFGLTVATRFKRIADAIIARPTSDFLYIFSIPLLEQEVSAINQLKADLAAATDRIIVVPGGLCDQARFVQDHRIRYLIVHCGWSTLSIDVAQSGKPALPLPRDVQSDQATNAGMWQNRHGSGLLALPETAEEFAHLGKLIETFEANLHVHEIHSQHLQTSLASGHVKGRDHAELIKWIRHMDALPASAKPTPAIVAPQPPASNRKRDVLKNIFRPSDA
jgi:hypothetical protein